METINTEAFRNAKLAVDLDNMRETLTVEDTVVGDSTTPISVNYPSPTIETYEQNFFLLLAKSKKYKFEPNWFQRPDYVSHHFYGNTIFWPLILFVNRIHSIEDFKGFDELLVPPFDLILKLTRDKISTKKEIVKETSQNLSDFSIHPLDQNEFENIRKLATIL